MGVSGGVLVAKMLFLSKQDGDPLAKIHHRLGCLGTNQKSYHFTKVGNAGSTSKKFKSTVAIYVFKGLFDLI